MLLDVESSGSIALSIAFLASSSPHLLQCMAASSHCCLTKSLQEAYILPLRQQSEGESEEEAEEEEEVEDMAESKLVNKANKAWECFSKAAACEDTYHE